MLDKENSKRISKFLSLVLRHKPEHIGIELNNEGWTDVEILIQKMNVNGFKINLNDLIYVVETNQKKRFAFNTEMTELRANQGHSLKIDHGFESVIPPEILFHGTAVQNIGSILKNGIDKRSRHHVHLSADKETAIKVGQRHGKPVVLEIMALQMNNDGKEFFISDNKVWLTDFVPAEYLRNSSDF